MRGEVVSWIFRNLGGPQMIFSMDIFHLINHTFSNPVFDRLMPVITMLGDGKFMLALAILLIIAVSSLVLERIARWIFRFIRPEKEQSFYKGDKPSIKQYF